MTLPRRRFLAIAAGWSAAAPTPGTALARTEWQGQALGAEARVVLDGPPERTRAVLADLQALLRHVEGQFSLYDPASALLRLNRTGALAAPHPDFQAILQLAGRLHRITGGRFDPTVQPLWCALAEGRDPGPARGLIGWARVRRSPAEIRLDSGQALTLNGIAQGYATDLAAGLLDQHGLTHGLVHLGEYAGRGGPWRIGVADPAQGLLLTRTLRDGAIATSSPDALRLGRDTHILDPQGAGPHWSTVSVEAGQASIADGLSTAACLMDRAALTELMARHGPALGVTRITAVDAEGDVRIF